MKKLNILLWTLGMAAATITAQEVVTPSILLLPPAIPGDKNQPTKTMGQMWEHAQKVLRNFDAKKRLGLDRGVLLEVGDLSRQTNTSQQLDANAFIAALDYAETDGAVNVRLRIYDSLNYLQYEYTFKDVLNLEGECVQEIAARIANYALDPKQFAAFNEAGDSVEELDRSDYVALDLSEFAEEEPETPKAETPRGPSPQELAARAEKVAKLDKQWEEQNARIAAAPNDPVIYREVLSKLGGLMRQYPWMERIPRGEELLAGYDKLSRLSDPNNRLPIFVPMYIFGSDESEVTPEAFQLPEELLQRRNWWCAVFREQIGAEQYNDLRAMDGTEWQRFPAMAQVAEFAIRGGLTTQPGAYWDYMEMQRDRYLALTGFLRASQELLQQKPQDRNELNELLLMAFGDILNPGWGEMPWDGELREIYLSVWGGRNEIRQLTEESQLPFAHTLNSHLQLILKWLDREAGNFDQFTMDYTQMLTEIRHMDPEWFAPGMEQSRSYLNSSAVLLLEKFVRMRFPTEAETWLQEQRAKHSQEIVSKNK